MLRKASRIIILDGVKRVEYVLTKFEIYKIIFLVSPEHYKIQNESTSATKLTKP